jgi:hypothetical protein
VTPLPRVTVAIPTFDRVDLLRRHALASALSQQGVDVDVVVVCDGSPDAVFDAVRASVDSRVRLIRHARSLGVAAARNSAIAAATGDWIAVLDDDDLWAPTKLARQIEAASRTGAGFAYSAALIVDETYSPRSLTPAPPTWGLLHELLQRNVMPGGGSNLVFAREVANAVGGFDGDLDYTSDWDMAIRLAAHGPGAAVEDTLMAWFRHSHATAPALDAVYADLGRLQRKHAGLLDEHATSLDEAATLYWVGSSELDAGGPGYRLRALQAFGAMSWATKRPSGLVHAARAILGRDVNRWLRERLRARPAAPRWLDRFALGGAQSGCAGIIDGGNDVHRAG